jgi:hypothetical protein
MAFQWAGDLNGAAPIRTKFVLGATAYQGQFAKLDSGADVGGEILPCAVAATANPDTGQHILGIISGIITSPTYTASGYNGDKGTFSATQATIKAYDPPGPCEAEVILVTPSTLIKAPIWRDSPGTALYALACTTEATTGLTVVTSGFDTSVDGYTTLYCRSGANAGQYRRTEGAGTTTMTTTMPFTETIAVGDVFVAANIVKGWSKMDWVATYCNSIDGTLPYTSYSFYAYVHELNLKEAGKEYCVFTLSAQHLALGVGI